jgi:hypothetical protein
MGGRCRDCDDSVDWVCRTLADFVNRYAEDSLGA